MMTFLIAAILLTLFYIAFYLTVLGGTLAEFLITYLQREEDGF